MSPPPQGAGSEPLARRSETKNNERPTGVGQKSDAIELTGSPRLRGACQGEFTLSRSDTQMSLPTFPGTAPSLRADAKSSERPSDDSIGHPSGTPAMLTAATAVAVLNCTFVIPAWNGKNGGGECDGTGAWDGSFE